MSAGGNKGFLLGGMHMTLPGATLHMCVCVCVCGRVCTTNIINAVQAGATVAQSDATPAAAQWVNMFQMQMPL